MTISTEILLDNPILIKHVRSRLRRAALVPWLITIVIMSICIAWAGFSIPWLRPQGALTAILGLQILILAIGGSQQVGGSVGGARESGILDFHRVSPQPPLWLAVGYFLGAPIREYLLFASTLPFAAAIAMNGFAGLSGLIELEIPLIFACWIFHAIALLTALASKKPKGASKGGGIGGLIVFLIFLGQPIGYGLWYASGPLHQDLHLLEFFGRKFHWFVYLLIFEIPILSFLFIAAARKMRADKSHAYSKVLAIGCLATMTLLGLGGLWAIRGVPYLVIGVLYGTVFLALILSVTITPDRNEYIRGLRRAERRNRHRPSPWEDAGTNRIALFVLAGVVLIGTTIAWEAIEGRPVGGPGQYSQTIAIGVLVVAYFGLALQYFRLRFPKVAGSLFALFLFLAWGLPIITGMIALGAFGASPKIGQAVLATSPLIGMALSANAIELTGSDTIRLFALAPAVTFAFGFNFLMVAVQRKIDLAVRKASTDRQLLQA